MPATGSSVGPYTILGLLGSGGMGHVYRAHDPRLGRDVAIKIVLSSVASDEDRLRRFEREAHATAKLNHPNIMAIYDIGMWEGTPYVVTELLEGRTLRDVLKEGPLPPRRAIAHAIEIAHGLEAAHRKEIVHRDLKPENLFITHDGCVKILDFGLAKLKHGIADLLQGDPASWSVTEPGVLLGTLPYMAPEQIRSEPADHRSDLYSLGVVLYEMVAGRRPFDRGSLADGMRAILHEDARPLGEVMPGIPPALETVVRRCLEKRREDRFGTARDLAFALEAVQAGSDAAPAARAMQRPRPRRAWVAVALAAALAVAAASSSIVTWVAGAGESLFPAAPTFQRLTFRRGWVSAARFAPEGTGVLYSAAWDGNPPEVFLVRTEAPESRPLALANADVLAVSQSGELALLRAPQLSLNIYHRLGTLARVSLGGGAPRDALQAVRYADWSPTGTELAVVREAEDRRRIEYPVGRVLYDTARTRRNTIVAPRVSRDGEHVAFFEGYGARVARWSVNVVNRAGERRTLSPDWYDWWRLAWSPSGDEVWFAASSAGSASALYGVSMSGRLRRLMHLPGTIELHDVAPDGRVLLSTISYRTFTRGSGRTDRVERDLSWLDASAAVALSVDGTQLLLDEHGEGGGAMNAAYLRPTDGSAAVRLGAGRPLALSPDGRWALATIPGPPLRLFLLPTGAGETRALDPGPLEFVQSANWFPDGSRLLLSAAEPGHGLRLYIHALDGRPEPLTAEGFDINGVAISPHGDRVAATGPREQPVILSLYDGSAGDIPGLTAGDMPIGWTSDGEGLFVTHRGELPATVRRVDLVTGRQQIWKTFTPPDAAGVGAVSSVLVTTDGAVAVYSYEQTLSELYLVTGLR